MRIIIIGSGISGLSAAIEAAGLGADVTLLSPYVSERAQSVMAAGGINAVMGQVSKEDSYEIHASDTLKGGCFLENVQDIQNFCEKAPENIHWIENMGVVFNRDINHNICVRAFGGQTFKRTAYAGSSTGKQIVTALVQKCREYEIKGQVTRIIGQFFHSALIREGECYGVLMMNSLTGELKPYFGDAVIMAVGGQNKIFGKTTGTENDDGYAVGRLFSQGVRLRNLEFIQYHPTTIETSHKKMLITEAARGEGGRLYYLKGQERIYFMEELYGVRGNLMPRDIVSKCIYDCPSQVYLDVAFLGEKLIHERLQEIYELCIDYMDLDITKESIPVSPSVHFFMGGIDVDCHHEANVRRLYAVGECASKYHGANRLGGNSLLAAVHSGRIAAKSALEHYGSSSVEKMSELGNTFADEIKREKEEIQVLKSSQSQYPATYILKEIAMIMNKNLGITRDEVSLDAGITDMQYFIDVLQKLKLDPEVSIYENFRLRYMALLAMAILHSAKERRESRGAHIRTDYPETLDTFKACSLAVYDAGKNKITISFRDENKDHDETEEHIVHKGSLS